MTSLRHYALQHDTPILFFPDKNEIVIDGEKAHLEPLQARLLGYFIEHKGEVVSAQQIASCVWQRSQVSDNLVRQVVSQLRTQLQDKTRPFQIIQTIPKQGYVFDLDVSEQGGTEQSNQTERAFAQPTEASQPETPSSAPAKPKRKYLPLVLASLFGLSALAGWRYFQDLPSTNTPVSSSVLTEVMPVYIHDIVLDSEQDYSTAESVYNYLFYGLNSAKRLSGYHFSQLSEEAKTALKGPGVELKSWLKKRGDNYVLTVLVEHNQHPESAQKVKKTFNQDNFFSEIGDLVLEIKAIIAPKNSGYEMAHHRVTSVKSYQDWQVISEGISLFYQGKGGNNLADITAKLRDIQQSGRDNYLVNALLSYSASLQFLQTGEQGNKAEALQLAKQAFEQNPRCDIANLTLGLALLINQNANQAYPYLFYAAESTPSPISFYLLSVVDKQSGNPKGSKYNYQRFSALKKEHNGQLFDLIESSQKANLL